MGDYRLSNAMKKTLLVISGILAGIGYCGGPLILRLYFVHGGNRLWFSTCLGTVGFPIIIIPLAVSYFYRRKTKGFNAKFFLTKLPAFTAATVLGVLLGLTNYLSTYGVERLPVSTAALIIASQLVFNALFAFLLVKQKFTAYTINAIALLTVGAATLALHTGSDRPEGESKKSYTMGFVLSIVSAALSGLLMPLIELAFKKAKQTLSYTLIMEFQAVMCLSATVFSIIGMIANKDFKIIPREAREYELGKAKYFVVLVFNAIIWQLYSLGLVGIIFCGSALLSGIVIAALLPVSEVLAVIFYHDKFKAEKGIALALCIWGFVSHFYGEIKDSKKHQESQMTIPSEMATPNVAS